jgi:hypothetical protein
MGRKIDHPVVGQRGPLHRRLAGVGAEMEVAGRRTELAGHRLEFVGRCENDTRPRTTPLRSFHRDPQAIPKATDKTAAPTSECVSSA